MKLVLSTQVMENYGSPEDPHWKFKGGSDYIVEDYWPNQESGISMSAAMERDVEELRPLIEFDNKMCSEYLINWSLEDDNFVPYMEQISDDGNGPEIIEPRITLDGKLYKRSVGVSDGVVREHCFKIYPNGGRSPIYVNEVIS